MLLLDKLAETKIKAAVDKGELENLPGQGKPLELDDTSHIPAELRVAYRILKNAGYLPPELEQRNKIRSLELLLSRIEDGCEKTRLITRLSLLKASLRGDSR